MGQGGGQRRDAIANRQAVIDAAAVLLAENPDAGMQEIADYTGLGRTTVYRHFPNRAALFEGLMEDVIAKGLARIEAVVERDVGTADLLRQVARLSLDLGLQFRFLYSHRDVTKPALQRLSRTGEDPLSDYLREARGRGDIRTDMSLEWLMSVQLALALQMVGDVLEGRIGRESAAEVLGDTIITLMIPIAKR